MEYYRRSVDELSSDEAVRVKDVENLLKTKMRSGRGLGHVVDSFVSKRHINLPEKIKI